MKAKFCCTFCQRKERKKAQADLGRNNMPHGDAEQLGSNGGWTTGCCTVQFIFKEVPGGNPREIQLKFFVRAWSQFCKSCNKVGDIGTYPDEIDRLSSAYAEYLMKVFFRHVRPNAKSRPQRPSAMQRPHLSALCSACKSGCCIYMARSNARKAH